MGGGALGSWLVVLLVAASLIDMLWAAFGVLGPLVAQELLGGAGAWWVIVAAFGACTVAVGVLAARARSSSTRPSSRCSGCR